MEKNEALGASQVLSFYECLNLTEGTFQTSNFTCTELNEDGLLFKRICIEFGTCEVDIFMKLTFIGHLPKI